MMKKRRRIGLELMEILSGYRTQHDLPVVSSALRAWLQPGQQRGQRLLAVRTKADQEQRPRTTQEKQRYHTPQEL